VAATATATATATAVRGLGPGGGVDLAGGHGGLVGVALDDLDALLDEALDVAQEGTLVDAAE